MQILKYYTLLTKYMKFMNLKSETREAIVCVCVEGWAETRIATAVNDLYPA